MTAVDVCDRLFRLDWSRWWQAYVRATSIGFTVVEYINQLTTHVPEYAGYEVTT